MRTPIWGNRWQIWGLGCSCSYKLDIESSTYQHIFVHGDTQYFHSKDMHVIWPPGNCLPIGHLNGGRPLVSSSSHSKTQAYSASLPPQPSTPPWPSLASSAEHALALLPSTQVCKFRLYSTSLVWSTWEVGIGVRVPIVFDFFGLIDLRSWDRC
jgi:hypothetical protein